MDHDYLIRARVTNYQMLLSKGAEGGNDRERSESYGPHAARGTGMPQCWNGLSLSTCCSVPHGIPPPSCCSGLCDICSETLCVLPWDTPPPLPPHADVAVSWSGAGLRSTSGPFEVWWNGMERADRGPWELVEVCVGGVCWRASETGSLQYHSEPEPRVELSPLCWCTSPRDGMESCLVPTTSVALSACLPQFCAHCLSCLLPHFLQIYFAVFFCLDCFLTQSRPALSTILCWVRVWSSFSQISSDVASKTKSWKIRPQIWIKGHQLCKIPFYMVFGHKCVLAVCEQNHPLLIF